MGRARYGSGKRWSYRACRVREKPTQSGAFQGGQGVDAKGE